VSCFPLNSVQYLRKTRKLKEEPFFYLGSNHGSLYSAIQASYIFPYNIIKYLHIARKGQHTDAFERCHMHKNSKIEGNSLNDTGAENET
jgi:hypothetical protein